MENEPKQDYKLILDSYVSACKTAYLRYKEILIQFITYTWIDDKGRFHMYEGTLRKTVLERQEEFHTAMKQLETFKETNADHLKKE